MPDGISRAELAATYGWALSVLQSDKSLWHVFQQAVKHTWTPERFVAELRNTKWFKHHSEAARNAIILRRTDPATWESRVNQTRAQIRDAAAQLGAIIPDGQLNRITQNVLMFGWNDAQIRNVLAQSVRKNAAGNFTGQAAANQEQLRQMALDNGVKISGDAMRGWLRQLAAGASIDTYEEWIRDHAVGAFPGFAKEIAAGHSVRELASPYINTMAQTLELNAEDIDLFDPTIRKALQSQNQRGDIVKKPLWQFENELRQDKRWRRTKNAQDAGMGVAHQVLRDMGLMS